MYTTTLRQRFNVTALKGGCSFIVDIEPGQCVLACATDAVRRFYPDDGVATITFMCNVNY